jgi:hypothetical protein
VKSSHDWVLKAGSPPLRLVWSGRALFLPKKERSTVRLLASARPVQAISGSSDVEASIEPMEVQAQVTGGLHSILVRHSGRWGPWGH